jgi:hypothetical protein
MGNKLINPLFKKDNTKCVELYDIRRQILDESSRKILISRQSIVCTNTQPEIVSSLSEDSVDSTNNHDLSCHSLKNTININCDAEKNKAFKIYHKIHIVFDKKNRIIENIQIKNQKFHSVKIVIGSNIINAVEKGDMWVFNVYIPIFLIDDGRMYIEIIPTHLIDVNTVTMTYKYVEIPKRFKTRVERNLIKSGSLYYTPDGNVY